MDGEKKRKKNIFYFFHFPREFEFIFIFFMSFCRVSHTRFHADVVARYSSESSLNLLQELSFVTYPLE